MINEAEILQQALVSCGKDHELSNRAVSEGRGLHNLLNTEPITIICDRLAQKLNEQGYRVTKTSENPKLD